MPQHIYALSESLLACVGTQLGHDSIHVNVMLEHWYLRYQLAFVTRPHQVAVRSDTPEQPIVVALAVSHAAAATVISDSGHHHKIQFFRLNLSFIPQALPEERDNSSRVVFGQR